MDWLRKLAFWRDDTVEDAMVDVVADEIDGCFSLPEAPIGGAEVATGEAAADAAETTAEG